MTPPTPQTLTRTQGYLLTDTHRAARLNADCLVTHGGLYQWNDALGAWKLDRAERIVKASGSAGTFVWHRTTGTFERRA
jgi:hypothetical protein